MRKLKSLLAVAYNPSAVLNGRIGGLFIGPRESVRQFELLLVLPGDEELLPSRVFRTNIRHRWPKLWRRGPADQLQPRFIGSQIVLP